MKDDFDPNQPYEVVDVTGKKKKSQPDDFDTNEPYEVVGPDAQSEEPSAFWEGLETVGNTLDVLDAPVRALGAGKFGEYVENVMEEGPVDAAGMAPSGQEFNRQFGLTDEDTGDVAEFGAGMATEIAMSPSTYLSLGTVSLARNFIRKALRGKSAKQTARAMQKVSPLTKGQVIGEGLDPQVLGRELVRNDLQRYINKPEVMKEKILGASDVVETFDEAGSVIKNVKSIKKQGLIKDIAQDVDGAISVLTDKTKLMLGGNLRKLISTNMDDLYDSAGKVNLTAKEKSEVLSHLKDIIGADAYSLSDLHSLKKSLNDKLTSRDYLQATDKVMMTKKKVMMDTVGEIKTLIEDSLSGLKLNVDGKIVDAGKWYQSQNNRLHNLIGLGRVFEMADVNALKKPEVKEIIAGLAAQGTIGAGGGVVLGAAMGVSHGALLGMLSSLGFHVSNKARREVLRKAPVWRAKQLDSFMRNAPNAIPLVPQMGRELRDFAEPEEQGPYRDPQSLRPSANLPLQLQKTKLPRTVEGIMQNKDIFLAKVAQQSPEQLDQIQFIVNDRPEDLEQLLPALIQTAPYVFESDKYGRINGKILDPLMQQKAREDLYEDTRLSNTQRINMIDRLNRTNELEDY